MTTFILLPAEKNHFHVIENLMQFYIYDFSEYLNLDVDENGLFPSYQDLENYYKDENKFSYIIKSDEKYIGFVLVKYIHTTERNYFSIAEFFILKKYRRGGIGKSIAKNIFDLHKGKWEIFQWEQNKPARLFWKNVINEYAGGKYTEKLKDGKYFQLFEN